MRSIFGTVRTICRCGTGHRTVSLSHSANATALFVWQEVQKYRLAREGQEVLVSAVGTADAGEALSQIAAGKVVADDLGDHRAEMSVGAGVLLGIDPLELVVVPDDELMEDRLMWPSRPVDSFRALRHEERREQGRCLEVKCDVYQTVTQKGDWATSENVPVGNKKMVEETGVEPENEE